MAVQLNSQSADFLCLLGEYHSKMGNLIELGNTFLAKKMYKEALDLHEKGITEFTSNIDLAVIYNSWGYALANIGDIVGAISKFEKALQLEPSFSGAQRNLDMILKFQKSKK